MERLDSVPCSDSRVCLLTSGGQCLVVHTDLNYPAFADFESASVTLCRSGGRELVIDLTRVSFMCSEAIKHLFFLKEHAERNRITLQLRLSEELEKTFDLMSSYGLDLNRTP